MILKRSFSGALATVALLALNSQQSFANQGVPEFIKNFDEVQPAVRTTSSRSGRSLGAGLEIGFEAAGRRFDLVLEPSELLAAGAEILRITDDGPVQASARTLLYSGTLADDPSAVVRVALGSQGLDGLVLTDDDMFFLEPAARYGVAPEGATLVYAASQVDERPEALGCGADDASFGIGTSAPSRRMARGTPSSGGLLEMAMVGDYELFQKYGTSTIDRILTLMNLVDGVYASELGVTIALTQVVVYETTADPFSDENNSSDLLDEASAFRGAPGSPIGDTGLAHLLTGRGLAGSVIGVAWVGVLCDGYYGIGLSEDFSPDTFSMTLLLSHEIGHNFGAWHDGESSPEPCTAGAPFGHIMWPSIGGGMDDTFSDCTRSTVAGNVAAASCIGPAIPAGCGDGTLDPGEECDDGNNDSGDCCRLDCKFDPPGNFCAGDANVCTDDICDGAGNCQHVDNTASCDDGDVCTLPGTCSGGVCAASLVPLPLGRVKLKAKFKAGAANDKLTLKANVPTDGWISPPALAGSQIEIAAGGSPAWSSELPGGAIWETVGSNGLSYRYEAGASPPPGAGGVSKLQIKYKLSAGIVQVKLKTSGEEFAGLVNREDLGLRIQVGNDTIGDCGALESMGCAAKPDKLVTCITP
jgi:cysteine-rich repeat protein